MIKINLVADIFGQTGYASHSRSFFEALSKKADVKLDCGLPNGWEAQVTDAELESIKKDWHEDGITYMIGLPHHWPQRWNEKHKGFVGCLVWEGDKIPEDFYNYIDSDCVDAVVVPSSHTLDAVCGDYIHSSDKHWEDKLHVVPHGVDTELFKPQEKNTDKFVFLANKGWASGMNDRGGLQYLFKAFSEEFGKDENVMLRVKINTAYCPPGWSFEEEISKIGVDFSNCAEVQVSLDSVPFRELPKLYNGDVFVSPNMSESFGLPMLEAMSCGLPVIATGFGGQTDFVNECNGWLIDYELREVDHDVMYEGIKWGVPDVRHLRELMREAVVASEGEMELEARKTAECFSWGASADKFLEVLEGLE